jgi:hypothetical protein
MAKSFARLGLCCAAFFACASPEEPPAEFVPASRYDPPGPSSAASDSGLTDEEGSDAPSDVQLAAGAIANAHCSRMVRCGRLSGQDSTAVRSCRTRVARLAREGLVESGCVAVNRQELDQCLHELAGGPCEGLLSRMKRILVCRSEEICTAGF